MVAETALSASNLILPIFVDERAHESTPIASMPGVQRHPPKAAVAEALEAERLGIPAVLLFGLPSEKDNQGSGAWNPAGGVQEAARAIRDGTETAVLTDVCLCEYTTHGHCGIVRTESGAASQGLASIDNDATLPLLVQTAISHARAGAHFVAPSAMMDGQVAAIRAGLDGAGFREVGILSYAAKFASAFYGPFRDAVQSAPAFGDRRTHQMDPPNAREAVREALLDVGEGADIVMVKPAGPYLDVVRAIRERVDVPVAAYQVSGEYAILHSAAERGWLDLPRATLESVMGIRRAGADIVITYFAKEIAKALASPPRRDA
jgi:porphobilinogen synthase